MKNAIWSALLLACAYAVASALAHVLSAPSSDVATFWVPSGLFLAALLKAPRRQWPMLAAAAGLTNAAFELLVVDRPADVAVGFAVANTAEALAGAVLFRWLRRADGEAAVDLSRVNVLLQWLVACLLATVLGAAIGAPLVSAHYGGSVPRNGVTWWVADLIGVLVVAPVLLVTRPAWAELRRALRDAAAESLAIGVLMAVMSAYLFWYSTADAAWAYALLPVALWTALRLRTPGVAIGMFALSIVAVLGANSGRGVFAAVGASAASEVTTLQGFLGVVTICLLSLAAAATQSEEAKKRLDGLNQSLAVEAGRLSAAATTAATRLRLALQGAEMGTWQWTVGTREATVDDRQRAILGLAPDEPLRSASVFARIHPDDLPALRQDVERWSQTGGLWEYEHRVRDRTGDVRWVSGRAALLTDASGQRIATGVTWDVTRQRAAEDALRESDERFRQLADHLDAGFWIYDVAPSRVRYASSGFLRTWRVDPNQLMSDPGFWASLLDADDRTRVQEAFLAFLGGAQEYLVDYRVTLPTGDRRWVQDRAFVVARDAAGAIRVVAGFSIDVTERREAEQALRESDRQKDAFLAMLAHELRNPLAPIRAATQVLALPVDAAVHEQARVTIERQVTHIVRLVDDLVDASRLSRGRLVLRQTPVDLCDIVRDTVGDYEGVMAAAGIRVSLRLPELPVYVYGDGTRLAQILGNLLHNARKFTSAEGRVEIALTAAVPGDMARLRVADSGTGIDAAVLPHVFDAFSQGTQALDRSEGGLGLGLSLVRGLVDLHGGRVEAQSDGAGAGAIFDVWLPVMASPGVPGAVGEAESNLPRLRVLVVEDNADAATMMRLWLETWGQTVAVAAMGDEALALLASARPDLLLCDIGLPGRLSGLDIARHIRQHESRPPFLVALTGYTGDLHVQEAEAAGFDRHLAKPVSPEALQAVIREAAAQAVMTGLTDSGSRHRAHDTPV